MQYKESFSESIADLIIATLCSARSTRLFRAILFERKLKRHKRESVRVALYRLQRKGYVKNSAHGWSITKKGHGRNLLSYIPSPFKSSKTANTVVAFDIPEKNRRVRNWLRAQLKIFNYEMLQKSLWIGPGPLPSSFIKRLEDLSIRKNVKIFNVKKSKL